MKNINLVVLVAVFAGVIFIILDLFSRKFQIENKNFLNELLKKQINRNLFAIGGLI